MAERLRWGADVRMRATDIRIGDSALGAAPVAVRPYGPVGVGIREAEKHEIRISVGRAARDTFQGLTTSLSFTSKTASGDEEYRFEDVTWRRSCCRLIGHT